MSRGEILYIGLISINQWGKIVPKSNDSVEVEVTMSRGPAIIVVDYFMSSGRSSGII